MYHLSPVTNANSHIHRPPPLLALPLRSVGLFAITGIFVLGNEHF